MKQVIPYEKKKRHFYVALRANFVNFKGYLENRNPCSVWAIFPAEEAEGVVQEKTEVATASNFRHFDGQTLCEITINDKPEIKRQVAALAAQDALDKTGRPWKDLWEKTKGDFKLRILDWDVLGAVGHPTGQKEEGGDRQRSYPPAGLVDPLREKEEATA